jgi:hypothetical protein
MSKGKSKTDPIGETMKPAQRKCKGCVFYTDRYCKSLENEVEAWWNGCIRNTTSGDIWNHRYAAYAQAHGKTPEEMINYEMHMARYMEWIGRKIGEWRLINNKPAKQPMYPEDHRAFDIWLDT